MIKKLLRTTLIALVFLASVLAGHAAVTPNSVITPPTPNRGIVQFTNSSSAGTYSTLYTAGTNGSVCRSILESNTETAQTHVVTIALFNAGTNYGTLGQFTTANGDGTATNHPAVFMPGAPALGTMPGTEGVLPIDSDGNPLILLNSGDTIQATFATAINTGKLLSLYIQCADF